MIILFFAYILLFCRESSLASKFKSNFKEAYNTNLIHTYINSLNSLGYSDTFNKLEKIVSDINYNYHISYSIVIN